MKMSDLRRVKEDASASAVGVGAIPATPGFLGQVSDTEKKKKRKKTQSPLIIRRPKP